MIRSGKTTGVKQLQNNNSIDTSIKLKTIAQVCPRYYPDIGGVNTHVKEISERLVQRGFNVEVLTTNNSPELPRYEKINGVVVRRFKSWSPGNAYHFSTQLSKFLQQNAGRYSVVHAHSYHAFPAYYAAINNKDAALVFTAHYHGRGHTRIRSVLLKMYKMVGSRIFIDAEKVVAVSEYERDLILKDFKIDDDKVEVIPNGIDKKEFLGIAKRKNIGQTILSVGRLEKYKGMQDLVRVMPHLDPSIKLEIVGKGPYQSKLYSLIKQMGIENRVKIMHDLPRKELVQKYFDSKLFVLLSANEAYGICVAEALASRTPCIVAKASALNEWVDNENCYGIDLPIQLEKLKSLIESTLGRTVQEVNLMDWDDITKQLINLYAEVMR